MDLLVSKLLHIGSNEMNKKSSIFLVIMLLIFFGSGLVGIMNQRRLEEKFYAKIPKDIQQIGIKSYNLFLKKDFDEVVNLFVDELDEEEFYPSFVEISNYLERLGEYKEYEYIGYQVSYSNGNETQTVTMQLDYSHTHVIFQFIAAKVNGSYKLMRTDFNKIQVSLKELNRFSLGDKGIVHYIVFLSWIIIFLFSVITASIAFGSDIKRRVLWSLFALCGAGVLSFTWTTAAWNFNLFKVGLPAAGFFRSWSYASFVLEMRLPIGAIVYWLIKHRLEKKEDTSVTMMKIGQ